MKRRLIAICLILILSMTSCSKGQDSDSETILWFNATYGTITTMNEGDLTLFGGYDIGDASYVNMIQNGLIDWWDVTDRKTADETLQWLLNGGHNDALLEIYEQEELSSFTRDELVSTLSDDEYTDDDRAYYLGIYDAVDTYGDNAILAWDLSRAMQLSSWYYIAGYYTYEEALDSCLEIAKKMQKQYTSWEDMMQSYLLGFQYWNEDDISNPTSDSYARNRLYEKLRAQENSPYFIDWNLKLQKDW